MRLKPIFDINVLLNDKGSEDEVVVEVRLFGKWLIVSRKDTFIKEKFISIKKR